MRMPDRLQYALHIDPNTSNLLCPPMTLLTLVENAVKHGIDPSEEGGSIEITAKLHEGRCLLLVQDSGVGLQQGAGGNSLGTGLATLRERLRLAFGANATLRLTAIAPHGVRAEIDLPAKQLGL